MHGKVAIVTGSSRGIGREIALALAKRGVNVVLNYQKDKASAEAVACEIRALGAQAEVVEADVRHYDQAQRLAERAMDRFGRIDVLVNNAGITRDKTFRKMLPEHWHEVIDVNLHGVFNATKAVIEPMCDQRSGCIVSISSIIGEMGNAGQANYAASKAAIIGFTKSLAKEMARHNVRVNAVAPGFTETDMLVAVPDEAKEKILTQIPLGTFASPQDVAHGVLYLCDESGRHITGHVLSINGGMYV
ncbi:MAG TPA: 3-oxoacyl-[acyl-carrier-protein] reductase [Stenomitos sp.]